MQPYNVQIRGRIMKNSEIPQNTFKRVQYAHTNLILAKINTFNQDKMQWHYIKTV
jgi:hypothetical protein